MAHPRRLRFGAQLPSAAGGREWVRVVQEIEDLGYATLSVPDHLGPQLAPIPALAVAGACTTGLRLTMSVLANDLRNPAMLAKEVATLDVLSDGRVELGLGTGWMTADYDATGIRLDPAGIRLARLSESVDLVRSIWSGQPVSFDGKHYHVSGLTGHPTPVQNPIPIMLGGSGPKMLGLAARKADIVSIGINARAGTLTSDSYADASREAVERKLSWVREAAGEREADLELCVRVLRTEVTDDVVEARVRHAAELRLSPRQLIDSPHFLIGTAGQLADDVRRHREQLGVSYYVISANGAASLAPVVQETTGT